MPKGKDVRVKMRGTTVWTVRRGDVISINENMARRWARSGLAEIIGEPKKDDTEHTVVELRDICRNYKITERGTKAEMAARIAEYENNTPLEVIETVEEDLPFTDGLEEYDPESGE